MKFLPLIWANLKRKKLRTLLTLLSILVAFLLFGYLCAIKGALNAGVTVAGADRLVVRHKVSIIQLLPQTYKARMENIPGVVSAVHQTWFGGIYQEPQNFFPQIPVVPEEFLAMYPEIVVSPETKKRWLETRTGAIVGRSIAQRFKWKVGDRIPIQATIWTKKGGGRIWEFDIVGIYDAGKKGVETATLYFRHDYFEESRERGSGKVGWYSIRIKDPAQSAEIAKKIDDEFANSPAETKTEAEGAFMQAFAKQVGDIAMITAAILSAVFFTILLVAGNTMAQSVRERTGELGALKAIGFTNNQVLALVLGESCLLSVLGGALGLGLATLLISRGDPTGNLLPAFHLPAGDIARGCGFVLALGFATGFLFALQAMRLRVADALRRM